MDFAVDIPVPFLQESPATPGFVAQVRPLSPVESHVNGQTIGTGERLAAIGNKTKMTGRRLP